MRILYHRGETVNTLQLRVLSLLSRYVIIPRLMPDGPAGGLYIVVTERYAPLRDYELIYIVNPTVTEEQLPTTLDKVNKFITDKGGSVDKVDQWGRRRLAYSINRFTEGNYVSTKFKFTPRSTAELENHLKLTEEIIRYLLIRMGD
ncbi:MAG: 30S ribosomal protein S6 [Dehalococcoidia bacterium]|nr:30S ribosomal protein S6 [Dehalococcoidia bacterium]